jgi:osmoprotectant transport system ATP-binding protein
MTEIELVGISKRYGKYLALDDVSVAFRKEKITAIVGRSGSGKSTLLKLINGLVLPTSGNVFVSGNPLDYNNLNPQRHQIGYVVQGNGLFPHLTIGENISIPGKITGKGDPSRVDELLKFVDLPLAYGNKYPLELSGGEQQRVAVARALYLNPPVLLMDEPFGSLDTLTRRELHVKILEIQRSFHLTIIIVTHDLDDAERLADEQVVIDKGRIQS